MWRRILLDRWTECIDESALTLGALISGGLSAVEKSAYRSAKALRHPKSDLPHTAKSNQFTKGLSGTTEAVPYPKTHL
jgi:hypothetical protein